MRLVLALLVCYCAGSLACRLTGNLALTAAALFSRCLQVSLVDGLDVLHSKPSPKKFILIISQIRPIFKRSARERKKVYILTDNFPMLSPYRGGCFRGRLTPATPPVALLSISTSPFHSVPASCSHSTPASTSSRYSSTPHCRPVRSPLRCRR